ncbi:MAG TPA: YihY/virulence factor BrkB family protein [Cryobacterium sp.]|nr:YihY/virulence factor BrkB family protein [Cryobacterium sp.]
MSSGEGTTAARVWREVVELVYTVLAHDLPKLAAGLTYFTVLSLLPALIVVVALLGLVGLSSDTVHTLLDTLGDLGAPWAAQFVSDALDTVIGSQSSGLVLALSVLTALWAASAYVGAFMWASDGIYGVAQRRPFWKDLPLRVGVALLLIVLLSLTAAVMAFVGPFGRWVLDLSGIGSGPLNLWSWIKWPLLIGLGLLLFAVLYRFTPSRRQPALWRLLPGAAAGVALWVLASVGFSIYLDHFASYNRVYGTLGAAVAFLVWAWVMNLALLVGVEVNREVEERRDGDRGADDSI